MAAEYNIEVFTKDQWYEIAKCVDNEFIGKQKTFSFQYRSTGGFYRLDSGQCDSCSIVRVYPSNELFYGISIVTRIGPDTKGYEEIHPPTYKRIINVIKAFTP